jgi:RHS repeat-associated protein
VIEYEPVRRVGVYANLPEPAYAYFDDLWVKECSERYIWLGNLLLSASYSEDERYYYYHDILGSVVGCSDVSGKRYARVEYDEFGNIRRREWGLKGIFLHTGHEWDAETDLYYFGARYYNPFLGRFITEDPVAGLADMPQTLNPYAYCLNDPLNYVDERGEFIDPITNYDWDNCWNSDWRLCWVSIWKACWCRGLEDDRLYCCGSINRRCYGWMGSGTCQESCV